MRAKCNSKVVFSILRNPSTGSRFCRVGSLKSICVPLLGIAILLSASSLWAQGWSMPKVFSGSQKKTKTSSTSQTLKKIDAGTKKFFRDTIDVITLKPLWDSGKKSKKTTDSRMMHTRKTAKKKPFWDSLFTTEEEPKKAVTVGEWVGMKRPE
ncbi:MAG: hypothetical protein JXM70_17860 [Pirellulales bacterium]|nr:hypothetical protein [Pirellulales bacterium]